MNVINQNFEFLAIATNHAYSGEICQLLTVNIYLTKEKRKGPFLKDFSVKFPSVILQTTNLNQNVHIKKKKKSYKGP